LTHLGCNSLQGYLLGRPMTAERLLESLEAIIEPAESRAGLAVDAVEAGNGRNEPVVMEVT
jgi:hypothetical protein